MAPFSIRVLAAFAPSYSEFSGSEDPSASMITGAAAITLGRLLEPDGAQHREKPSVLTPASTAFATGGDAREGLVSLRCYRGRAVSFPIGVLGV